MIKKDYVAIKQKTEKIDGCEVISVVNSISKEEPEEMAFKSISKTKKKRKVAA